MLCEGGPRLLAQIAAAGLLDELCLTVSPVYVAGDAARIMNGEHLTAPGRLRLAHVFQEDDFLYVRYVAER
jgi:riboflavin biosynthesis pyrimidine reductase